MRRLDRDAQLMLDELAALNTRMRDLKATAMSEARKKLRVDLEDYDREQGRLAHKLLALGVPKVAIREEGLHTKDNNTLMELLSRHQETGVIAAEVQEIAEQKARFSWLSDDQIRVNWKDAKTYLAHTYAQHVQGERGVRMDPSRHSHDISGIIKYNPDGNPAYEYVDDDQKTDADESMVKLGHPYSPGPLNTALGDPEFIKAVDEWRTR